MIYSINIFFLDFFEEIIFLLLISMNLYINLWVNFIWILIYEFMNLI